MANEKIVNRENLKTFRQAFQTKLENGQIVPLTTKNISPISEESGTIQETPFVMQGTGTANNTEIVDTSPVGKQLEKQGNTICLNQLVENGNFADTSGWTTTNATLSVSSNVATFTAGSRTGRIVSGSIDIISGHKYLLICSIKKSLSTENIKCDANNSTYGNLGSTEIAFDENTNWQTKSMILVSSYTATYNIRIVDYTYNEWTSTQVKNVQLIDLTQWFNNDIPQDLLDNPSHWSWYQNYGDYIAYNTGELVNCAGRYLVDTFRNQWNEKTELGTWGVSGKVDANDKIRSDDYILVKPNITYYARTGVGTTNRIYIFYYDKNKNYLGDTGGYIYNTTFTTPSNCWYIAFYCNSAYGTTYNNDITISLYYATGDGYSEYYAYEQPKVYDTGVEVLRKASSVKDIKAPDGTITRRIGTYTFTGQETWETLGEQGAKSCNVISSLSKGASGSSVANVLCPILIAETFNNIYYGNNTNGIAISSTGLIVVNTNQVNNLTGKTIYYELATPTTEQGTPFAENIEINDYGTMYWLDTNNALVEIPQGTKLFYPADYVLLVDSLNSYTNGSVDNLALKSDLTSFLSQTDKSNEIVDKCGLTYLIKKAYIIGNIGFLNIVAKNETGSTIASGTQMFLISSGFNSPTYERHGGMKDTSFFPFSNGGDGKFYNSEPIANNETIYISISYVVA